MSEIPFVNALGDAIERSAAAEHRRPPPPHPPPPHRSACSRFAVAATGVAAASGVFSSGTPEQLATTGIGCYSRADLEHADVAVLGVDAPRPGRGLPQHAADRGADGRRAPARR